MKILASIVTHNRLKLLKKCISSLQNQTRKLDEILIINNGSTDGTLEYLNLYNYQSINQENSGSAGGWYSAIEYAIKNEFDAVWLMDDDGYADHDSLEKLVNYFNEDYSCISSIVVNQNNKFNLVFPMPLLKKNNLPKILSFPRKIYNTNQLQQINLENNLYDFCHLFNGALLSVKKLKLIGNINKNFYMFGDEVDYFFRLRKVGKVRSLITSYHYHPDVSKRPLNEVKLYYYIKNSIILNYKYFDFSFLRSILNIFIGVLRFFARGSFKSNINFIIKFKFIIIIIAIIRGFNLNIDIDYEK